MIFDSSSCYSLPHVIALLFEIRVDFSQTNCDYFIKHQDSSSSFVSRSSHLLHETKQAATGSPTWQGTEANGSTPQKNLANNPTSESEVEYLQLLEDSDSGSTDVKGSVGFQTRKGESQQEV